MASNLHCAWLALAQKFPVYNQPDQHCENVVGPPPKPVALARSGNRNGAAKARNNCDLNEQQVDGVSDGTHGLLLN